MNSHSLRTNLSASMDKAVLEAAVEAVLPDCQTPGRLLARASRLLLRSKTALHLKPSEEPARVHLCVVVACEMLQEKFDLPDPSLSKLPIQPNAYSKLLDRFRNELNPDHLGLDSPQITPVRTPGRGESRSSPTPVTPTRLFRGSGSPPMEQSPSPRKRQLPSKEVPTPTKESPTKRRNQNPTKLTLKDAAAVSKLCKVLGVTAATEEAVQFAYDKYSSLVTDSWGLTLGLTFVTVERAEPELCENLMDKMVSAAVRTQPKLRPDDERSRLEEWIHWARQILTSQTWLSKISMVPEPQPQVRGSAGGWDIKLEPDQWWLGDPMEA